MRWQGRSDAVPADSRPAVDPRGAVAVGVLGFAASANTIANGFVWDDAYSVLRNPWVREPGRLHEAFTHHLAGFVPGFDTSFYRPLSYVVHAGVHAVAGLEPWAFHLLNVLLHAAVCVAVYVLLARWTPGARPFVSGPLLAASLFAVHPIHAEAVAWVSSVSDLGAALFGLLALLTATVCRPPRPVPVLVPPVLFLAAVLFKEPAFLVWPVVAAVRAARGDFRDPLRRGAAARQMAAFAGAAALYLALRANALGGPVGGGQRGDPGLLESIVTAVALFGGYVIKLLAPVDLCALHDAPAARALSPWFLCGAGALASIAAGLWSWRRRPAVVLGLTLFALPLMPSLYVARLGESPFAERYLYLPSAGAALLLSLAFGALPARSATTRWLVNAAAVGAIGACAWTTFARNAVWRDDLALWSDTVERRPRSAAAHESHGFALLAAGRTGPAAESLERALQLDPRRVDARVNLASALVALGRPGAAIDHVNAALSARPDMAPAHAVAGEALAALGRLDQAVAAFRRALELDPGAPAVHNAAGIVYARMGRRDVAREHFREAVRLDPGNSAFARNLDLVSP